MKLYICWTTIQTIRPPHGHPCHNAYKAVTDAGYDPEVIKVRGLGVGPKIFHQTTEGRKEVERLTGKTMVPVLVTDDGEVITESQRIVEWAKAHPAQSVASSAAA
jgi:Glutathione S-transferase, N-terminal domain